MQSPPIDASYDLQGASRITGGFARGHAIGNVFNFADAKDVIFEPCIKRTFGKVLLYTSMGDPNTTKPLMSLKHEISSTIGPVLENLAKRYTLFDSTSMFFCYAPF